MGSKPPVELALSRQGAEFIARFEGFRATPYLCPAGHLTIGFGHRIGPTEEFSRLTEGEALDLLLHDAAREAAPVAAALQAQVAQHQADALISLAFNVGGRKIARSTLMRLLASGNALEAAQEFRKWNKAGGRESRGLGLRRAAETRLFTTGEYGPCT